MRHGARRAPGRPAGAGGMRLRVDGGRVACPLRGLVDVVECFMCPYSRGLSPEHEERVVCTVVDRQALPGRGG